MTTANEKRRLVLVTDQQGKVVGAAMSGEEDDMQVGMEPLEGQVLHEMELPRQLRELPSQELLGAVLEGATVSGDGQLRFRKYRLETDESTR